MEARGTGNGRVTLGDLDLQARQGDVGASGDVKLVIRPERVQVEDPGSEGPNRVPGMIERTVFLGPTVQVLLRLVGGQGLQAIEPNRGETAARSQGEPVSVYLPADDLRVLAVEEASDRPDGARHAVPAS
jgi:hypothetical protein